MTRTPWLCGVAILGLLLVPHTVAAQGVGAIGGTIVDESGAVLPGVTMTLTNPGTIGGNQTRRESSGFPYWSTSGMRAVFRNGIPDSANTYNTPNESTQSDSTHAIYIEDRWRPVPRLTLNLGLRFETNYGWQPATCQPETQFVKGQCFTAIEGAPDWTRGRLACRPSTT